MAGIFGEFFLVSVSHKTKHENSSINFEENSERNPGQIRAENSKNSGNFRSATVLTAQRGRVGIGNPEINSHEFKVGYGNRLIRLCRSVIFLQRIVFI